MTNGKRSSFATPSRFFAGYFKNVGVKEDKSRNFPSFRHSTADAFRRGGYMDEPFVPLLDHTKATTAGIYGVLPQGVLSERQKVIEAIIPHNLSEGCLKYVSSPNLC